MLDDFKRNPLCSFVFLTAPQSFASTVHCDSFEPYYRTTLLSEETDPDKLHDLQTALDGSQVFSPNQLEQLVERFLGREPRDRLEIILDACMATYNELDEDAQVDFKGKAKAFVRTYAFLAALLPYTHAVFVKKVVRSIMQPDAQFRPRLVTVDPG